MNTRYKKHLESFKNTVVSVVSSIEQLACSSERRKRHLFYGPITYHFIHSFRGRERLSLNGYNLYFKYF